LGNTAKLGKKKREEGGEQEDPNIRRTALLKGSRRDLSWWK